jgi:four helix bundle protein
MGGESKIKNFTDLIAWQKAHQLVLSTYKITKTFPESERYVLTSQTTRASLSISSNIAEGFVETVLRIKFNFMALRRVQSLNFKVR